MSVNQKDKIHETKWDLLIILDACRFDTFERINWLPGRLRKARSAGSDTMEWVRNTFVKWYDVIYVSGIPYISSKYSPRIHGPYVPRDHFFRIEDVWNWGYDEEANTVMPDVLANVVLNCSTHAIEKPLIAHFIQPHAPMIGEPGFTMATWRELTGDKADHFPKFEQIFEKGYKERLIEAYDANLKKVLEVCSEKGLFKMNRKVVITSDHGEGFGENGIFGHSGGINDPVLREVPFFEVA